ncbi:hypothetical protein JJV70_04755 [Streptomyces sp. JJ66]|uniref:hypothetical protein n=1 Tax=Streptomyces sp. JJ66 TaxID=2803843 RepID=UPI001C59B715|nr:hypothetical protein [Streptomyces sp. JJ66]MBW1601427.1 hypothetical protein [Streptomyces sp. JJ66]
MLWLVYSGAALWVIVLLLGALLRRSSGFGLIGDSAALGVGAAVFALFLIVTLVLNSAELAFAIPASALWGLAMGQLAHVTRHKK